MQQFNSVTLEAAARNDDNSNFGNHATWQTSAAWEFIDGYRIIGSYGTAYKAPTMSQIHSKDYGNPDLKPEESKQWEGGFEGLTGPVNWRVTGYRNDIDNLINSDPRTYRYYNVDEARIKGIEVTAQFDTGPVGHQISYDYVDPRNVKTNEVWHVAQSSRLSISLTGRCGISTGIWRTVIWALAMTLPLIRIPMQQNA